MMRNGDLVYSPSGSSTIDDGLGYPRAGRGYAGTADSFSLASLPTSPSTANIHTLVPRLHSFLGTLSCLSDFKILGNKKTEWF